MKRPARKPWFEDFWILGSRGWRPVAWQGWLIFWSLPVVSVVAALLIAGPAFALLVLGFAVVGTLLYYLLMSGTPKT